MGQNVTETRVRLAFAYLTAMGVEPDKSIIAAVETLLSLGYSYKNGADKWRPPAGQQPNFNLRDVVKDMQHIGYVNKYSRNFYEIGVRDGSDPNDYPVYMFKEDIVQ